MHIPRFAAIFYAGAIALASACAAPPPPPAATLQPPPPAPEPAPIQPAPPVAPAMEGPVPQDQPAAPIEAEDAETARLMMQLRQEQGVRDQQQRATADQYYAEALRREAASDIEGARDAVRRALEAFPGHVEAQRLKNRLDTMLSSGPAVRGREMVQRQVEEWMVQLRQSELEVLQHIRTAQRLTAERKFADAVREYENARFKIRNIPFAYPPLQELLPHVERSLQEARRAQQDEEARLEAVRRREAEQDARLREEAERREVLQYIADQLEWAYMFFDLGKYDECVRVCDRILTVDPDYRVARELKQDALAVRHRTVNERFVRQKIDAWKRMALESQERVIPYSETVRFPSRDEWLRISQRAFEEEQRALQRAEEEQEVDLLGGRLESIVMDYRADGETLDHALRRFSEQSGVPVLLHPKTVRALPGHRPVRLSVSQVSAAAVLRLILAPFALDYRSHPDGYILAGRPEDIAAQPVVEIYDVADIALLRNDAEPPPALDLTPPEQAESSRWLRDVMSAPHGPAESRAQLRSRVEDLIGLIRRNVAPGTWDRPGHSIRVTPTMQLLVVQSPEVQDELRRFLSQLRSYTGTMVSVTARFIAAYDDFLSDVGVDWIRRPPTEPSLLSSLLPDNESATGSDTSDPSSQRGVGFVIQERARLEYYDLRGYSFHTFRGGRIGDADFDVGRRMNNSGGLGLALQIVAREFAGQMILTALEKSNKATVVQAPRITMFNNQRAHIFVLQNTAYIADYSPALAAGAGALDPIIGLLQTGVVLDVRPVVSNDRRYVTLELRPTLAELQTLRQLRLQTVDSDQGLIDLNVQLPHILLQRAEATVQVPDQGAVLLTGFRDIFYRDVKSEIPFLGKIPIIGFLFQRQGKSNEQRHLMIVVSPEIIDMSERENQVF